MVGILQSPRLNLGCGALDIRPGYTNIDIVPYPGVDIVADVRYLPDIPDESVDYIVAQHILECLPRADIVPALLEWRRLLKVGCHLEIRVVDIALVAKAAFHNSLSGEMGLPIEMVLALLYGKQESEYDIKMSGFSATYLQGILVALGFSCVSLVYEEYDIIISVQRV